MTDTRNTWLHRLRHTPLRDLLRGRASGRLDWRGVTATSGLPPTVAAVVTRTVRRTRLWRLEKSDVAAELAAHFADGLDAGTDAETLIRDFGDERTAAKLIGRSKRRQRPLVWQAWRYASMGMAVLMVLYSVVLARFLLSRPVVGVNYFARVNAPVLQTAEADRAWPIYRRAVLALGLADRRADDVLATRIGPSRTGTDARYLYEATPADAEHWPRLTAWLDAHAGALSLVRDAAAKPTLGFVLGRGGSADDAELNFNQPAVPDDSVVGVRLPHLHHVRSMVLLLSADARYAATQGDRARTLGDLHAIFDIARQRGTPFLIETFVHLNALETGLERVEQVLAETPGILSDADLIALAHRLATIGGDTAGSLIDPSSDRLFFYDWIQRAYSDDGHGDGRLTAQGMRVLQQFEYGQYLWPRGVLQGNSILTDGVGSVLSALGSRRDVTAEYDRLMNLYQLTFSRPLRDWPVDQSPAAAYWRRHDEIRSSPLRSSKYLPVLIFMPSSQRAVWLGERLLGRREGVCIGLALELHRRRHGQYPATLEALTPTLLPHVPVDRIDGRPLQYRLIDGRPVVYSVGADGDDDGGRVPVGRRGEPEPWRAAEWPSGTAIDTATPVDGDWLLYDGRASASR